MALHFFKYAGRLASASGDTLEIRRNLVDVLIIGLSAANAINLSLGVRLKTSVRATSLGDLSRLLGDKVDVPELSVFAALEMSRAGGRMAKALESLDHIERGDPRVVLETSISELVELALLCLGVLEVDIRAAVENRYSEVEAASIFQGE
jgi:hypothetical protein